MGKKQRALDALYDVIKSKKHRTWQKIHEPIMEKYLQLCVDLKKSHIAKEGLYQYKNICQQVWFTVFYLESHCQGVSLSVQEHLSAGMVHSLLFRVTLPRRVFISTRTSVSRYGSQSSIKSHIAKEGLYLYKNICQQVWFARG